MSIDVDMLRIGLIILGIIVLVWVYLWERFHSEDNGQGELGWQESKMLAAKKISPSSNNKKTHPDADDTAQDAASYGYEHDSANDGINSTASSLENPDQPMNIGNEQDSHNYWHSSLPGMILQIIISAKISQFKGVDVVKAATQAKLIADATGIFHCYENENIQEPRLFSMASMVKPGAFPMQSLENFQTPGLILFSQLPAHRNGLIIFTAMLTSAKIMAKELGGELQDDTRSRLTPQTIKHIHTQLTEYQRQLQIASRRSQEQT